MGVRGYFVRLSDDAGDVGDLRVAAEIGGSLLEETGELEREAAERDFCFFCFVDPSLYSFMRMERLAGVASSGANDVDFERVWCDGPSGSVDSADGEP